MPLFTTNTLDDLFATLVDVPRPIAHGYGAQAFYTDKSKEVPERFVKRTSTQYASMPLTQLKEMGLWSKRLEKIIPFLPEGAWIAGGFLRSIIAGEDDTDGDIDFFFQNDDAFNKMLSMVKNPETREIKNVFGYYIIPEYEEGIDELRVITCKSEVMHRPDIQLVKLFWYESPEHVIDGFDFTVCQLATDGKRLYYNPLSFDDIRSKAIRVHRSNIDGIVMLNRIIKYSNKGYSVSQELFDETEAEAIAMFNNGDKIKDYFYQDKENTESHEQPASFLKYAWEHLADSPRISKKWAKLIKHYNLPT